MDSVTTAYHTRNQKITGSGLYAAERVRLIRNAVGTGKKLLDLGGNHGALTRHYCDGNAVTIVDFDAGSLARAKETLAVSVREFDLNQGLAPLGEGQWEAVVMSEVLEHLYYPEKKVSQVARLLAPGGVLVGTVPNGFSLKNRLRYLFNKPEGTTMAEPTHITHFSYRRLKRALRASFEEVHIVPIQGKFPWLAHLSPNLFAFMLGFVCRKPRE